MRDDEFWHVDGAEDRGLLIGELEDLDTGRDGAGLEPERPDLGDADDPVTLRDKGEELDQLDEATRDWNASVAADGRISIGVRSEQ